MMAALPAIRLKVGYPPFTHTGVDYFGPILVTIFRRTIKRWDVQYPRGVLAHPSPILAFYHARDRRFGISCQNFFKILILSVEHPFFLLER